jgi:DNA-binding transcriptional LysR family regulator
MAVFPQPAKARITEPSPKQIVMDLGLRLWPEIRYDGASRLKRTANIRLLRYRTVILSESDPMLEAAVDGLGVAYVQEHEAARHIEIERLVRMLEDRTTPSSCFFFSYIFRKEVSSFLTAFLPRL